MENVDNSTDTSASGTRPQHEDVGESRDRNLDILKAYIQRQRTLLERIKQDVDRLQSSKPALVTDPGGTFSRTLHVDSNDHSHIQKEGLGTVIGGIGKLTELVRDVHGAGEVTITKEIDWNAFRGADVAPLRSLQPRSRTLLLPSSAHLNAVPPLTPRTPSLSSSRLSLATFVSLDCVFDKNAIREESMHQIHVREERTRTVDPALTIAAEFITSLPPDSDDECVKQARAKEAREAKEAKAKEAKEARKARLQNVQNTKPSSAKPNKKNSHVRKSAHRRKSEASAAAAALRPRGYGGRFKKKEAVDESLATASEAQAALPAASPSAPALSTSISTASVPELSSPSHFSTLAVSTPATNGSFEELLSLDNGRPQRTRKPSIRFGSAAPSGASTRSTRSRSSTSSVRIGSALMDGRSYSSAVPSNPQRGRLTIRIPARIPASSVAQDSADNRNGPISSSTSTATAFSGIENGSTNQMPPRESGEYNFSGKAWRPLDWTNANDGWRTPGPPSVAFSETVPGIKREEEVQENGMDVDDWNALEERNDRSRLDPGHESSGMTHQATNGPSEAIETVNEGSGGESDSDDDSFVCEVLPPLLTNSASKPSAKQLSANAPTNGNGNRKTAEPNRTSSRRGDPSSKTFNVAWSDEEQRLLDKLLEQYPDGTKNRWANISRAMGGTRTPRQVASRVQKYFAKMKKWGIDVT